MRLLVSVANAAEASAALAGGADVIDAKDPYSGALGPVSMGALREIHAAIASAKPLSAALGDATDEAVIERRAQAFIAAGALFVKVGFGEIVSAERVATLATAAVRGGEAARGVSTPDHDRAGRPSRPANDHQRRTESASRRSRHEIGDGGVIFVAYADTASAGGPAPMALVELAARAGAAGVLLDTANKRGPGVRGLVAPSMLGAWVAEAHDAGLVVAVAGKLTADDLVFVRDAGADIAGVRGAACDEGRTGRVTAARVGLLIARLGL